MISRSCFDRCANAEVTAPVATWTFVIQIELEKRGLQGLEPEHPDLTGSNKHGSEPFVLLFDPITFGSPAG